MYRLILNRFRLASSKDWISPNFWLLKCLSPPSSFSSSLSCLLVDTTFSFLTNSLASFSSCSERDCISESAGWSWKRITTHHVLAVLNTYLLQSPILPRHPVVRRKTHTTKHSRKIPPHRHKSTKWISIIYTCMNLCKINPSWLQSSFFLF